mmetsp:Transcript_16966/g.42053  ORF Transcript_16966/g.42053 Transcript_16966/m.42053 type:complete len:204 (+) Transcript_16966:1000-1611(+)
MPAPVDRKDQANAEPRAKRDCEEDSRALNWPTVAGLFFFLSVAAGAAAAEEAEALRRPRNALPAFAASTALASTISSKTAPFTTSASTSRRCKNATGLLAGCGAVSAPAAAFVRCCCPRCQKFAQDVANRSATSLGFLASRDRFAVPPEPFTVSSPAARGVRKKWDSNFPSTEAGVANSTASKIVYTLRNTATAHSPSSPAAA